MYITNQSIQYQNIRVTRMDGTVRFEGASLAGVSALSGSIAVYTNNGFQMQTFDTADYLRQEITDGLWVLTNIPLPQPMAQEPVEYDLDASIVHAVRFLMKDVKLETADEIIRCSALYPEWTAGKHTVGETFLVGGEPWTCFQAYDNAVYPDIAPGQNAWYTFNKPYHGTSRETARQFVHPTGAHDMYKAGEWAVQGGKFTKCVQDTSYSLEEYAAAWEVEE
nr:MAG TPA: hypothetical protein [Caudoviricetes sp.]